MVSRRNEDRPPVAQRRTTREETVRFAPRVRHVSRKFAGLDRQRPTAFHVDCTALGRHPTAERWCLGVRSSSCASAAWKRPSHLGTWPDSSGRRSSVSTFVVSSAATSQPLRTLTPLSISRTRGERPGMLLGARAISQTVTRLNYDRTVSCRYCYDAYGSPKQLSADWLTWQTITDDGYGQ